ncbi:MAG: cell envelope integrity protein CreD [Opitutae bacterium]|nr:cell envelope integrity protein CreD [Opitutae bacterium]
MNRASPPVIPTPGSRRFSIFLKILSICLLIPFLHIPLVMTDGVLRERRGYQNQATKEIAGLWGRAQQVTGPVLAVPYAYKTMLVRQKIVGEKVVAVEEPGLQWSMAYFLPDKLAVQGTVEPEVRHRGIYEAVVYSTTLKFAGGFLPDFAAAGIESDRIDWAQARVLFGVTDLRGIRTVSVFRSTDGKVAAFEAAEAGGGGFLPLEAKLAALTPGARIDFEFEATLQGSERLQIVPAGKATTVKLAAPWADPSFCGAYLPVRREVAPAGFAAEWEVAHFSRGFPQSWTKRTASLADLAQKLEAAGFGVAFARPVDGYRLAERAQKYGVLFFVLVFAVFFLFEATSPALKIHPLQYAIVGAALALFFLGFLALSEFWTTGRAYGAAAALCTLLVSLYAWSFLKTGVRTLVIGGGLGATYGYLYFVLKSQDYALVAGTAALFAALALVMFCTRRINWYSLEMNTPVATAGQS